jgi:hypothetical protein
MLKPAIDPALPPNSTLEKQPCDCCHDQFVAGLKVGWRLGQYNDVDGMTRYMAPAKKERQKGKK